MLCNLHARCLSWGAPTGWSCLQSFQIHWGATSSQLDNLKSRGQVPSWCNSDTVKTHPYIRPCSLTSISLFVLYLLQAKAVFLLYSVNIIDAVSSLGELYTEAAEAAMEAMKGRLANQYYQKAEEAWAMMEE